MKPHLRGARATQAALEAAASPSGENPFATLSDVGVAPTLAEVLAAGNALELAETGNDGDSNAQTTISTTATRKYLNFIATNGGAVGIESYNGAAFVSADDAAGKLVIGSDNTTGNPGDVLSSDGNYSTWQPRGPHTIGPVSITAAQATDDGIQPGDEFASLPENTILLDCWAAIGVPFTDNSDPSNDWIALDFGGLYWFKGVLSGPSNKHVSPRDEGTMFGAGAAFRQGIALAGGKPTLSLHCPGATAGRVDFYMLVETLQP